MRTLTKKRGASEKVRFSISRSQNGDGRNPRILRPIYHTLGVNVRTVWLQILLPPMVPTFFMSRAAYFPADVITAAGDFGRDLDSFPTRGGHLGS